MGGGIPSPRDPASDRPAGIGPVDEAAGPSLLEKAMQRTRTILLLSAVLAAVGCATGPEEQPPSAGTEAEDGTRWVVLERHPDGSRRLEGEQTLSSQGDWVSHGRWIQRFPSGAKEVEWECRDGELHGPWLSRYESGNKRGEGSWSSGSQDGRWIEWYESGQKSLRGTYVEGQKVGRWFHWREDGTLDRERTERFVPELTNELARGAPDWSAQQACGPPDVRRRKQDSPRAWEPQHPRMGVVWLEVSFPEARRATGLRIWEACTGGCVTRVQLADPKGDFHTVWTGEGAAGDPGELELEFDRTPWLTRTARVFVDTGLGTGWKEIDAVALLSLEDEQWACEARATSAYGEDERAPALAGVVLAPRREPPADAGSLVCGSTEVELQLSSEEGRMKVKTRDGRARLPEGWYGINHIRLEKRGENGKLASIQGQPTEAGAELWIEPGQETRLAFGTPLKANLEASRERDTFELSFSLTGAGGVEYDTARASLGRARLPAPGFEVVERSSGEIVASGRFRYG